MAITNYTELQAAIAVRMKRSDLTAVIPDYIGSAEAEFNRTLRLSGQLVRADLDVSDRWTDLTTLTAPLAEIRSISTTASGLRRPISYMHPEQAQNYSSAGLPRYYSRHGDELEILPPPTGTYTLELLYWRTIPDLATNSTNFLLTLAPDLYLYRSMLEGAVDTRDDALAAVAERMYLRALAQVVEDDKGRTFGASGLQMRVA